jgi:hypothetical protein
MPSRAFVSFGPGFDWVLWVLQHEMTSWLPQAGWSR